MVNRCRYCNSERKFTEGKGLEIDCCYFLEEDWAMSISIESLQKELISSKKQRSEFRELNSQNSSKENKK